MDVRISSLGAGIFVISLVLSSVSWGSGEEHYGNHPLAPGNYRDWPGIMPLLEQPDQVYSTWVNGTEDFYYSGNIDAFNDALSNFAAAELEVHEVVIRPGPGIVDSFRGERRTEFLWHVNVVGGISRRLTEADKGEFVWRPQPTISLYVTDESQLDELNIPEDITLLNVADVSKRTRAGLSSSDQRVRGWGAYKLARLDPYDETNLDAVIRLLDDDDDWVRLNAAGVIELFGPKAQVGADALKKCLESDNDELRGRAQKTLDQIDLADDNSKDEMRHQNLQKEITKFIESVR